MKTIRQQQKRDIVDTSTHPFCTNGHICTKGAKFPTVRRGGRKGYCPSEPSALDVLKGGTRVCLPL